MELTRSYSAAKQVLAEFLGATEDLLHLHAGLIIFFAAALLFRRTMRSRVPIALVYVFALANEAVDFLTPDKSGTALEPLWDILNTVVWPTLLFLLARRSHRENDPDKTN